MRAIILTGREPAILLRCSSRNTSRSFPQKTDGVIHFTSRFGSTRTTILLIGSGRLEVTASEMRSGAIARPPLDSRMTLSMRTEHSSNIRKGSERADRPAVRRFQILSVLLLIALTLAADQPVTVRGETVDS